MHLSASYLVKMDSCMPCFQTYSYAHPIFTMQKLLSKMYFCVISLYWAFLFFP